jgi:hypothetical protein
MHSRRIAFFQLGADFYNDTPAQKIAIGDENGMREEWTSPDKSGGYDRVAIPMTGTQPWLSIHGVKLADLRPGRAAASRGLIVRSWRAVLGGKSVGPHLSTFCSEWGAGNHRTALELSPPPGLRELQAGDFVEAEIELVVFPSDALAYYGPDQAFLSMLQSDANTWRPVQREAHRRAFAAKVVKGERIKGEILTIAVDAAQQARVELSGGFGHLPVRLVGLKTPDRHQLRVNDEPLDDWQTEWIAENKTWQICANISMGVTPVVVVLEPTAPK